MERNPEYSDEIDSLTPEGEEDTPTPEAEARYDGPNLVPSFFSRPQNGDESEGGEPPDSMSAFISRTMAAVAEPEGVEDDDPYLLPRAPRTFTEVGLSKAFLTDLTLKIIHYSGTPSLAQLVRRLGLTNEIVTQLVQALSEEHLIEVMSQSDLYTGNYRYRLSDRGQSRVSEALERSRYAGPAPVTAEQYTDTMRRVLEHKQESTNRARIKAILNDLVLGADVSDALARALYSEKSMMIYGPSGNGKTVLLEQYAEDLGGFSLVPYAIYAYGQVIRVYDQSTHVPLESVGDRDENRRDRRWLAVKRPAIVVGAEMDRETMEVAYDPLSRFYQAPAHLKAQNGALIVDDFGRQRIETRDLLTRWLIPLERGWDTLTLVTGEKLVVPFKLQLLFATNLPVRQLADEALLRRILYKVQVPDPDATNFAEIMRRACREKQIRVEDGAVDYAVTRLFERPNLKPRGSHAREILDILIESASFDAREPVLDRESFDRVFDLFVNNEAEQEYDEFAA